MSQVKILSSTFNNSNTSCTRQAILIPWTTIHQYNITLLTLSVSTLWRPMFANSVDPDELAHTVDPDEPSHQDLHYLLFFQFLRKQNHTLSEWTRLNLILW